MDTGASAPMEKEWGTAHRLGFRFGFAYLVLYSFLFPEGLLPGTNRLIDAYTGFWNKLAARVAARVFRFDLTVPVAVMGNGDRLCNYVQILCTIVLAVLVMIVWSIVDTQRKEYRRVQEWLRVYLRYVIALSMLLFGVVKVLGGQFFPPSLLLLNETYGQSSRQTLLWTFMGVSAPYTFFAGALETIGGSLLYFRKTMTLGALIVAAVMTNVVMMNLCYDVPVKQYSLHLLLMSVTLLAPDLRRLADFLLFHRVTQLPDVPPHFSSSRGRAAALGAKALLIGWAVYRSTTMAWDAVHAYGRLAPKHPLYGYYEVEEFVASGQSIPPLLTDASRWRTLFVAERGSVVMQAMNGSKSYYQLGDDVSDGKLRLASSRGDHVLAYSRPDADHLVLEGRFTNDPIVVRLKRVDESSFPLVRGGFRWIMEESD